MSRETRNWLDEQTLIGDTDLMGFSWHYRRGTNNHFPGPVPIERVQELIAPWEPQRQPIYIRHTDGSFHEVPNFIGVAPESDPYNLSAIHTETYKIHNYKKVLLDNVLELVGKEDLHISSAVVLAGGAVAAVEVAISEQMNVEGFPYRPYLLATTSSNGRFGTSWGRKVQFVVCDNTHEAAEREQGQRFEIRHTAGSDFRLRDAAEAVGIILAGAMSFEDEFRNLDLWKVPPKLWNRYLDEMIPHKDKDGFLLQGAALTRAENKREDMNAMWNSDHRVAPWAGSAFGVLQHNSTWQHHNTTISGKTAHRYERNAMNAISGQTTASDANSLGILRGLSEAYGFRVPEAFSKIEVPELTTV